MLVAIFVPIYSDRYKQKKTFNERSVDSRIREALGLARAIKLNVVHYEIINIAKPCSSTLFRIGKVNEFAHYINEHHIMLSIVDHFLTPVQQRNLEKLWNCKV
ncbi:MAG: GTPase HflX, partial [Bartonella sp.]|nr:GTPase HflX [Bartonella sp.]